MLYEVITSSFRQVFDVSEEGKSEKEQYEGYANELHVVQRFGLW